MGGTMVELDRSGYLGSDRLLHVSLVVLLSDRHQNRPGFDVMKRYAALIVAAVVLPVVSPGPMKAQTAQVCDSLEVLILLDESGSIDTNDPGNLRIDATKDYLANLRTNQQVDISVALAGFAATFKSYSNGFLDLKTDADRLDRLVDDFADRHADYEWDTDPYRWHTDYIEAFRGILDMPWSADCRRTVWFSDGRHDLDHRARAELLGPRTYDALGRELTDRQNLAEVESLLIPAICGTEESYSQIRTDYFALADKFTKAQMPAFEIRLFYLEGDRPYGETLRLFEMLNKRECGALQFDHRPVDDIDSLPDDFLFNAACGSLPGGALDEQSLTVRPDEGVVWNGTLPPGIASHLVASVQLVAIPGQATLQTDHARARHDTSNPSLAHLTLDFDREHRFSNPVVTGRGVEQICGSVVFEPPDLDADTVTSPVMAGQPAEFSLTTGSIQEDPRPLLAEERNRVTVRRDDEPIDVRWTGDGHVVDPAAPTPGFHTYRFELGSGSPLVEPSAVSIPVQVEGVTLDAEPSTSRTQAGQPVEFAVEADGRPLTPDQQDDLVVYRDDQRIDARWTGDGKVVDPASPPGAHTYRFELREGGSAGWVTIQVDIEVDPLPFGVELLTSPVLTGRPVEFAVSVDFRPLSSDQWNDLEVFRNGQPLNTVWAENGIVQDPAAPDPGMHTYRFELDAGPAGLVTDLLRVEVDPQPPGPIMQLDHFRLRPLVGADLTVPVKIDDTPGCVELDTSLEVEEGDGSRVAGTVEFPDRNTTWCSGTEVSKPTELEVELERQVNTDQGMTIRYHSVSTWDERQLLEMSVPGPIDRERNQTLERLLTVLLLLIMFALLWLALYGVNRYAGRLPRPRNIRYAEFTVDGDGKALIGEADHRLPRWSPGRISAGRLQAVRKTPFWRVWRPPYAELSMSGAPSLAIMGGDPVSEMPVRSHRIGHKDRILEPVVLIEENGMRGTVMAGIDQSAPAGQQLTGIVEEAMARMKQSGYPT